MFKNNILLLILIAFIAQPVFAQKSSSTIMDQAQKKAINQDKEIFLLFHASWCGWCKRMDKKMATESTKDYFDDHFAITHLTVLEDKEHKGLENPGGMKLLKKYKGEKAGLPFWVILDKDGKILTNSFDASGSNLGCPASKKEVADFVQKLTSATDITKDQQKAVTNAFVLKDK